MSKEISKKNFMKKLGLYLSFHFNDDEVTNILNDYEDWFENEKSQGKSESEIYSALESPKAIVKNLLSESGSRPLRISVFFHNTMLQILALIIIQFLSGVLLLRICNRNALNFFFYALGINFLYFITGFFIIKKPCYTKSANYKDNLPVFGLTVFVILFEFFFIPKLNYPIFGKVYTFGMVYVLILSAVVLILFVASLYFATKKLMYDKPNAFFTMLHISGTMTLLFFSINQMHMLYKDMSEYTAFIYNSIEIYLETIVLCLIFYTIKRISARRQI